MFVVGRAFGRLLIMVMVSRYTVLVRSGVGMSLYAMSLRIAVHGVEGRSNRAVVERERECSHQQYAGADPARQVPKFTH